MGWIRPCGAIAHFPPYDQASGRGFETFDQNARSAHGRFEYQRFCPRLAGALILKPVSEKLHQATAASSRVGFRRGWKRCLRQGFFPAGVNLEIPYGFSGEGFFESFVVFLLIDNMRLSK